MVLEELFNSAPRPLADQTKRVAGELDRATASNLNSAPVCTYFAYNGQDAAASCSDVNAASASNRFDSEAKASLIRALSRDSKAELAAQTKRLFGELDRATASKLLHLCCNFDSAECASAILGGDIGAVPLLNECDDSGKSPLHTAATAHASRCVEVLLKKHARTDLRTKDGQAQLALELSLADTRIDLKTWNLKDFSVDNLVIRLTEKQSQQLRTVKLLSEKTPDIAEVAYSLATKGLVDSLTALLIVAAQKVNDSVLKWPKARRFKEKHTLYECLVREALALGGSATPPLRTAKRASTATEEENSERRKLLLREIELLQLFGAVAQSGGGEKKVTSPLIRAAQGGDEAVIQLLLRTNIDVNDADAKGNTALHWILKTSRLLCPQQIKILSLLLDHGARVSQRNRLGLTAFHIAAGNGNSEALEVLLLEDPFGVQYKTEMKETPLFFAVKNKSEDCTKLLLTWGADYEVLNKRNQRAIDLAMSQEMRHILLNAITVSLIDDDFPYQLKCTALELADEETTTKRNVYTKAEAEVCKCINSHQDGVRGAKCFYAQSSWADRLASSGYPVRNITDSCKVKGTTNISWLSPEFAVIAIDSRGTHNGKLVGDEYQKFDKITPHILATKVGDSTQADNTILHMINTIGDEIRDGTDVKCVWNAGQAGLSMEKDPNAPSSESLIAGVQSKATYCCYLYDIYEEGKDRLRVLKEVPNWKAIGSGSAFATTVMGPMWKKYKNGAAPLLRIVRILNYSILLSALFSVETGGIMTVICIRADGTMSIESSNTVLQLYICFYKTQIRLPHIEDGELSEDAPKYMELAKLEELEGRAIFLFYDPHLINMDFMKEWLMTQNGIDEDDFGHPLTELKGGKYMHRVVFETTEDCSSFLKKARQITRKTPIPFSRMREGFKRLKHKGHIFLIAEHTLEMLKSLESSEAMKKSFEYVLE